MTKTPRSTAPRQDPRVDRSRALALEAARALLVEGGWDSVTQPGVAARSNVSRATVYRHWPDRADLLRDVLQAEILPTRQTIATADLRSDLLQMITAINEQMVKRDLGRVLAALVDRAEWDEKVLHIKREVIRTGTSSLRTRLSTAVAAGEIEADADIDRTIAHLVGSLIFRSLIASERVTARWLGLLVDDVVELLRPRADDAELPA